MLDQAFEALPKYDWGMDPKTLQPIDAAVVIVGNGQNEAIQKDLESRLIAVLKGESTRDAKDYTCRQLRLVGTKECVPALASLLPQEENSHMARFALERIPAPEATTALREALSKVSPALQVGVISSLGVRKDAESVSALAALLAAADIAVARAAAFALGDISTEEASKALAAAKPAEGLKSATTDASLSCAQALLAGGKKTEALMIYKGLAGDDQPKHVRLAATRGILACAGKS
jgi:HEAT repeat protein